MNYKSTKYTQHLLIRILIYNYIPVSKYPYIKYLLNSYSSICKLFLSIINTTSLFFRAVNAAMVDKHIKMDFLYTPTPGLCFGERKVNSFPLPRCIQQTVQLSDNFGRYNFLRKAKANWNILKEITGLFCYVENFPIILRLPCIFPTEIYIFLKSKS